MRGVAAAIAVTLLATQPACTLVGLGVGSGITATHNAFAEDKNDWSYTAPMLIGAGVGLLCDIAFILMMKSAWSKPMS